MSLIDSSRIRRKYFAKRFTLLSTDTDKDLNAAYLLFQSEHPGSLNFNSVRGSGNGIRFNIRIKPETEPIWVKFNDVDNDPIYIAGDEVFEHFNLQAQNIYITSATGTIAQVQDITTVADSSGSLGGTYFKLHAQDTVEGEYTYGVWLDVDNSNTQPFDDTVDEWAEVDISADDADTVVATAVEAVIEALTLPNGSAGDAFTSAAVGAVITVTHATANAVRNAEDATTGFTFSTPSTAGEGTDTTVNVLVE